jgi:hypothetical protein
MILLFQINPCASESVLALEHMRSFFECVLCDYYHHDVRTISAMMLERIADARQRGGGLSLPPESLFSLASRIEDQLASAKQCTPQAELEPRAGKQSPRQVCCSRVCAPRLGQTACRPAWCLCSSRPPPSTPRAARRRTSCRKSSATCKWSAATPPGRRSPTRGCCSPTSTSRRWGYAREASNHPGLEGRVPGGSGLLLMRLSLALDSRTSTRSCRGVRCNMTVSGRWSMLYMGLEFGVCEITCTLLGVT